jgi:polyketide biosynthesis enoyl-CoA hydratase PksH
MPGVNGMEFRTIQLDEQLPGALKITINRIEQHNSINEQLLIDIETVLNIAEQDANNRLVIIQGSGGYYCTGMDFTAVMQNPQRNIESRQYITLLKRLTTIPRVIISLIDGTAMAGGIGLLAASDLVLASAQSQFSLSEALWGLLPCCVLPYLIRRIGYQAAYRLTLTTQPIDGQEAYRLQLVDELTNQPEVVLRKYLLRFSRLDNQTLMDMKAYFQKLWVINDETEQLAINEITRLLQTPRIQQNLTNYLQQGRFPWDKI